MRPTTIAELVRPATRSMGLLATVFAVASMVVASVPSIASQRQQVDAWRVRSADEFVAAASRPSYVASHGFLVWTTDGCSNAFLPDRMNDSGAAYDFTNACWHHDFVSRNYRRFVRAGLVDHPGAARKTIDTMFRNDMRADCAPRPTVQRTICNARADLYYRLVRRYGSI